MPLGVSRVAAVDCGDRRQRRCRMSGVAAKPLAGVGLACSACAAASICACETAIGGACETPCLGRLYPLSLALAVRRTLSLSDRGCAVCVRAGLVQSSISAIEDCCWCVGGAPFCMPCLAFAALPCLCCPALPLLPCLPCCLPQKPWVAALLGQSLRPSLNLLSS